jgi:S-adenosylmethionine synthetase
MRDDFIFSSESVTEGHPDKLCDQLSDAIVDRFLTLDPFSRVTAECAVAKGIVFIAVQFASTAHFDIPMLARDVIARIGYTGPEFNAEACNILTSFSELPADPLLCRDEREMSDAEKDAIGARNQVTVFGYACTQTAAMMPLPIWLAHKLARRLAAVRLEARLRYLAPDGKTQVAIQYRRGRPHRVHSITILTALQRGRAPGAQQVRDDLVEHVIVPAFADEPIGPDNRTALFINPEAVVGGPEIHAGLTGRKTAIDTYGEYARHSGAALSGKDPARIDRVAAYVARHAAKNVIAAGLAEECEVQLSYTIGLARPASIRIETFDTATLPEDEIVARLEGAFDFRPAGIIAAYQLRHMPARLHGRFYSRLGSYGQVGRMDIGLPWETTEKAAALRLPLLTPVTGVGED